MGLAADIIKQSIESLEANVVRIHNEYLEALARAEDLESEADYTLARIIELEDALLLLGDDDVSVD